MFWRKLNKNFLLLFTILILFISPVIGSYTVYAQEIDTTCAEEKENSIYDRLKERMDTAWDKGMEMAKDADPIEISGNLAERLLRTIAASLNRNLRSIKAGSLLVGVLSFLLGSIIALLARKDKKIRKWAVGACMCAIPSILLVFVFGVSWFVSFFK